MQGVRSTLSSIFDALMRWYLLDIRTISAGSGSHQLWKSTLANELRVRMPRALHLWLALACTGVNPHDHAARALTQLRAYH